VIELAFDQGRLGSAPVEWKRRTKLHGLPRFSRRTLGNTVHRFQDHCGAAESQRRLGELLFRDGSSNPVPFPDSFANEFWLARGLPTSKMQNASYFHHLRRYNEGMIPVDQVFFEDVQYYSKWNARNICIHRATQFQSS
jgi:hypothetical protein